MVLKWRYLFELVEKSGVDLSGCRGERKTCAEGECARDATGFFC